MAYMPPYSTLKDGIAGSDDGSLVVMSRDLFRLLVGALAQAAQFDAKWYQIEYPDVVDAIFQGDLDDELDHFITYGYEEGRLPARLTVEEAWYRDTYPDVDEAIRDGSLDSAEDHYNQVGYVEGRTGSSAAEHEVLRWQNAIAASADLLQTPEAGAAEILAARRPVTQAEMPS